MVNAVRRRRGGISKALQKSNRVVGGGGRGKSREAVVVVRQSGRGV